MSWYLLAPVPGRFPVWICIGINVLLKSIRTERQNSGFQSTMRGTAFSQKILEAGIEKGLNSSISFYSPGNCELVH